jgi:hypothetical protein
VCMTGHLPALSSVFASMFLSERVPLCSRSVYKESSVIGKCRQARHLEAAIGIDGEANPPPGPSGRFLRIPPFRRFLGYADMNNL